MSGRSHRRQWRRLSVIETNDNEQGRQTDEPEAEASARASVIWNTASVLKRNAVVWSGDFVADERAFAPAGQEFRSSQAKRNPVRSGAKKVVPNNWQMSRCTKLGDWRSRVLEGVSSFSTIFNCTK